MRQFVVVSAAVAAVAIAACRPLGNRHAVGPAAPFATISGLVVPPPNAGPLGRRWITATNTGTGRHYRIQTTSGGEFTLLVPAGTYRLSVQLQPHEAVAAMPPDLTVGDGEAKRNVRIALAGR